MTVQLQQWLSSAVFFIWLSTSLAGAPEKMALQAVKAAYDLSVGTALNEVAKQDFGNKMVNRFLVKFNKKLKDLFGSSTELDLDMLSKVVGILDMCIEHCCAFKIAVTPDGAKKPLDSAITAFKSLKKVLDEAKKNLEMAKSAVQGSGGSSAGGNPSVAGN